MLVRRHLRQEREAGQQQQDANVSRQEEPETADQLRQEGELRTHRGHRRTGFRTSEPKEERTKMKNWKLDVEPEIKIISLRVLVFPVKRSLSLHAETGKSSARPESCRT